MAAGYSGTPLAKKLGIKAGSRVLVLNAPGNYDELLGELPEDVEVSCEGERARLAAARVSASLADIVHLFTNSQDELMRELARLRNTIRQDAAIWVSWYKKAAKLPTEITEDTIREVALPIGLVDVKVCAVDEKWSGLKVVIRKENRRVKS